MNNENTRDDNPAKRSISVGFFSKMSTKITLLISLIVSVSIIVLIIVATNRATHAMQETYLNYSQNLAEEAAIGVDFATEFGEEAYGGSAMNLAQEAAVSTSQDSSERRSTRHTLRTSQRKQRSLST